MSAGMAEVIAAHTLWQGQMGDVSAAECQCGQNHGAFSAFAGTAAILDFAALHAAHVADELGKAGYGKVPDIVPEYGARVMLVNGLSEEPQPQGLKPNPSWFSKSTHFRLVGPWQELEPLPDPLAAAMADPEGRALVQAIHDRKAEA